LHLMEWRISLFTSLPVDKLDRLSLVAQTRAIADRTPDAAASP
jgi:hypothetical protein